MTAEAGLGPEFSVVAEGAVVLTANRRLAAHLRARHDRGHAAAGRAAWESPEVMPLSVWVRRVWADQWREQVLLSQAQALAVWEQVIGADAPGPARPGNPRLLARRAFEAHTLRLEWDLAVDPAAAGSAEEVHAFLAWERAYAARCREAGWADPADALPMAAGWVRAGAVAPPATVHHAGFDRLPPRVADLLSALAEAGSRVAAWPAPEVAGARVTRVTAADPAHEAGLAARWARARLAAGATSIGIVAPDVGAVRFHLERALRAQLAPGAVADPVGEAPVNFALGRPLAAVPVCAQALACLKVDRAPQEIGRLRGVLRSPYLEGARAEAGPRAAAELHVLRKGWGRLTPARFRERLGDPAVPPVPVLRDLLGRWQAALDGQSGRRRPSAWAAAFDRQLAALGWPGEGMPSALYQAVRGWRELLAEFSGMDAVTGPLPRAQAVGWVERMARDTVFQPEGEAAAVQVLGTLEAAGMAFDHLWVLGLNAQVWPAPSRPTPFLPFALQRAHGLPHATAEVELNFARAVTGRLCRAAAEVVLSHPAQVEGRETRPSPLIAALPEADPEDLALADDVRYVATVAGAGRTEAVADGQAPPVAAGTASHGGASVFEDQSKCPFKAFARHRLRAEPPDAPRLGLDAAERGRLPHRVLERVWNELRDSATLAATPPEALRELVAGVVERELSRGVDPVRGLAPPYLDNERERLVGLVLDWLAVEGARGTAFTVLEAEERVTHETGGTRVTLRVDRIDRLADGSEMLIDYKTGRAARTQWDGERPEAPQLPLYAGTRERDRLGAVAFAKLKRDGGDLRFEGYTRVPGALGSGARRGEQPLDPAAWADRLAGWGRVLEGLGREFAGGRADVAPADYPKSCGFCGLEVLCRIAEREGVGEEAPSDA